MVVDGRRVGMHWPEILNPPHVSALQKQAYIHTHTSRSPLPSGGESGVERGGSGRHVGGAVSRSAVGRQDVDRGPPDRGRDTCATRPGRGMRQGLTTFHANGPVGHSQIPLSSHVSVAGSNLH